MSQENSEDCLKWSEDSAEMKKRLREGEVLYAIGYYEIRKLFKRKGFYRLECRTIHSHDPATIDRQIGDYYDFRSIEEIALDEFAARPIIYWYSSSHLMRTGWRVRDARVKPFGRKWSVPRDDNWEILEPFMLATDHATRAQIDKMKKEREAAIDLGSFV